MAFTTDYVEDTEDNKGHLLLSSIVMPFTKSLKKAFCYISECNKEEFLKGKYLAFAELVEWIPASV